LSKKSTLFFQWNLIITRNFVICNHSICNYIWLHVTICHFKLYFIKFTNSHHLLIFTTIFVIIKLYILPYWFFGDFSSKSRLLCSFNFKINCNLVYFYGVFIQLIYIKVLWTPLGTYNIHFIQGILNGYFPILWAYWIEKNSFWFCMVHFKIYHLYLSMIKL